MDAATRLVRRDALIERYGSAEAALAPCQREQLLRTALAPWIEYCAPPHGRWTHSVDGEGGFMMGLPEHLRKAVESAYPMPQNFQEAKAEYDYWEAREQEMADVLGEYGDHALDRPAHMRSDLIWKLVYSGTAASGWQDVRDRLAFFVDRQFYEEKGVKAVLRDVEALLAREPRYAVDAPTNPRALEKTHG